MASMNDLVVSIGADISNLRRDMTKMEKTVTRSSRRMSKSFSRIFQLSNLTNVARGLKGILTQFTSFVTDPIQAFARFDEAMRMVGIRSQASIRSLAKMTKLARQLGKDTTFTAQEVADSMLQLATLGFKPDQIRMMERAILDLARATGTDLTLASETAGSLMRQFGIEAYDFARVVDIMTFASNNSMLTVQKMQEAFRVFGPSAKSLGTSLEEAAVAAMLLSNSGMAASTIGTGLRRVLNTSAAEAEKLKKIFKADFLDDTGTKFIGLSSALQLMNSQMDKLGMTTTERAVALNEAFSLLGVTTGLVLTDNAEDFVKLHEQMLVGIEGLAASSAEKANAGMMGSIKRVQSAWADFKLELVAGLERPLLMIFDKTTNWIKSLSSYLPAITKTIREMVDHTTAAWRLVRERGIVGLGAVWVEELGIAAEFMQETFNQLAKSFADILVESIEDGLLGTDVGRSWKWMQRSTLPPLSGVEMTITRHGDDDDDGSPWGFGARRRPDVVENNLVGALVRFREMLNDMSKDRKKQALNRQMWEDMQEGAARWVKNDQLWQDIKDGVRRGLDPSFGSLRQKEALKDPGEMHGIGGGAAEQLGSAAAYRKVFDYFTGQKKNKADQERNKILKQIEENTKGFGGDDDSGMLGLPGEF